MCVGKLTNIDSDNGLSPELGQAIIWTNVGILLIGPLGANFSEILIRIQTFSFKKRHLKVSSAKWRSFCLGLNVLNKCWPKSFMPYTFTRQQYHAILWDLGISGHLIKVRKWISNYILQILSNPCPNHTQTMLVNSLWPSDAIWRHKSGSPLAQVMACCLMASSHYLNQYWLIISEVLWHLYMRVFHKKIWRYQS